MSICVVIFTVTSVMRAHVSNVWQRDAFSNSA